MINAKNQKKIAKSHERHTYKTTFSMTDSLAMFITVI